MRRSLRIAFQLAVSGGLIAYLLWKIDLGATADYIASSNPVYVSAAAAIYVMTLLPMAWRWRVLLASKGLHEPLAWLTKLYFIGYAASQVLPTGIGGDAVRMVEHARKRPRAKGEAAAAILMERIIGSAGILIVVAVGLALAFGRYDNIAPLIWVEVACVVGLAVFGLLLFSRRANALLQERIPRGSARRLQRGLNAVWTALHGYRWERRALGIVLTVTVGVQFVRMLAIWLCGEAVGVDVSPLVYVILGPLLFLVTMVPVTVNGLGVRESFFVFFLARFGVPHDAAFAAALPGGLILAWRSLHGAVVSVGRSDRAGAEAN
jgi:uncharacterized protein (TIRG00374 family)